VSVQSFGTGDGPTSFSSLGLQVGGDWSVSTNTYDDRSPILSVTVGRFHLAFSAAGDAVTGEHLEFAHALVAAAGEYLIECDRIALETADRRHDYDDDDALPLAA
jgi:hypothetical protein